MGCFPPDDGMTNFVLYCSDEELSEKVWASEFAISGISVTLYIYNILYKSLLP